MQKIPTLFQRDPATNMRTLTHDIHPDCQWVLNGEGRATRKLDGTCAMIRDGQLYKRREVKKGKPEPEGFELVAEDANTGKRVGWIAVGDGPEDKYFREAMDGGFNDGTFELVGPKVQGNPEGFTVHTLVAHGAYDIPGVPRDYDGLAEFLSTFPHEGIVWHHPDGRMAKIKCRDF
tara:strand:- start:701 stop:1228 length:528 start_codon:yes stop_codon:yes gene_type:complete